MNIRNRLDRVERMADEIAHAQLRTRVRMASDAEIVAHLWRIPVDRVPATLGAMPRALQLETLERLRQEALRS